jgi:hypothetical protein
VRINHHGFAGFTKAAAVGIFSGDDHAHTHKNPRAAPKFTDVCLNHVVSMLLHKDLSVNECVRGVFPARNLEAKYLSATKTWCFHFLPDALRAMILHVIEFAGATNKGAGHESDAIY